MPKVVGSFLLTDFKPISLINGVYKLVARVLSLQLSTVFPSFVADTQQAFIRGHNILDCWMMANEIIHLVHRRRQRVLMFKLFKRLLTVFLGIF